MRNGRGGSETSPHPKGFELRDGVEHLFHFIFQLKTTVEEVDL